MKQSDLPKDLLDGALKIFIQEVEGHLRETKFILTEEHLAGHPLLRDAKIRFHKIRGGAGFFGFLDIEKTAKELEAIFVSMEENPNAEEPVQNLYHELEVLVNASLKDPQK